MNTIEKELTLLGIGGGGANFLADIKTLYPQKKIHYIACDTDPECIAFAKAKGIMTLLWGKNQEEIICHIDNILKETQQLAIFTSLGGTTGSRFSSVVAERALALKIPTIIGVTIPFTFESKERREKAKTVATLLEERVADTLVFDMDKLKEDVGNYGIGEGFAKMHKYIFEQMIQLLESNHLTNQ